MPAGSPDRPTIAVVAGEASGDQLGAALIKALAGHYPQARFVGIGGPRMRAIGFDAWWDIEELSVMGLFEVARHLPRLLRLRRALLARLGEIRPDVLIGIDAPDFNLRVEKSAREMGLTTVHYVSPTVWAWRPERARKIGQSADLLLCLFPFEPGFYDAYGVNARYTGHPLADAIRENDDPRAARRALGLDSDETVIALLPGSRVSEASRLAGPMLQAAWLLAKQRPGCQFVAPLANASTRASFEAALEEHPRLRIQLVDGQALQAMAAADVVVCASGTAALECMLVNRPMVVTYRLSPMTYALAKSLNLVKTSHISLPNLLAGETLVPELIQQDVSGDTIASEVDAWLDSPERRNELRKRFSAMHGALRTEAAATAAQAIADLLKGRSGDR